MKISKQPCEAITLNMYRAASEILEKTEALDLVCPGSFHLWKNIAQSTVPLKRLTIHVLVYRLYKSCRVLLILFLPKNYAKSFVLLLLL